MFESCESWYALGGLASSGIFYILGMYIGRREEQRRYEDIENRELPNFLKRQAD